MADLADNAQTTNKQKFSARTSVDETTTILNSDYYIGIACNKNATVKLPAADEGCAFIIADESNANTDTSIKIVADGATIEGEKEYVLNTKKQKIGLLYNRGDWRVISNFTPKSFSQSSQDEITNKKIDFNKNNISISGTPFEEYLNSNVSQSNENYFSTNFNKKFVDANELTRGIINTQDQTFGGVKKFISGINNVYTPVIFSKGNANEIISISGEIKNSRGFIVDNCKSINTILLPKEGLIFGETLTFNTMKSSNTTRFIVDENKPPIMVLFGQGEIVFTYYENTYKILKCYSNCFYTFDVNIKPRIEDTATIKPEIISIQNLSAVQFFNRICISVDIISACLSTKIIEGFESKVLSLGIPIPWSSDFNQPKNEWQFGGFGKNTATYRRIGEVYRYNLQLSENDDGYSSYYSSYSRLSSNPAVQSVHQFSNTPNLASITDVVLCTYDSSQKRPWGNLLNIQINYSFEINK